LKKNREAGQLTLAGTEEGEILARLSERVEKAVQTIQELRRERDALRARLDESEKQLHEQGEVSARVTTLEEDHERFQQERGEIRSRIESILSSLEELEESGEGE
jgi:FtsZ-binding cell division protein ZapB